MILVFATVSHHEPWADEAQAWLLARDSGLLDLWTHLLRLEGTPGLWHTILHVFIRMGMPYAGLNILSGLLGCAAALLLLRYSPFPRPIRLVLPFTYFLCFQYSVVARSYSLAPILLFAIAAIYQPTRQRALLLSLLLSLLALVSAQGLFVSSAIALTVALQARKAWSSTEQAERERLLRAGVLYLISVALIAVTVWPGRNATFAGTPNWTLSNAVGISRYALQQAFGGGYWPVVVIALSTSLLWRGRGLFLFAVAVLFLCGFGALIYSNVWHHGFLVLAWLFALWISAKAVKPGWPALLALAVVIVMQCSWTWKAVTFDWHQPYSGSRAMAGYLKDKGIGPANLRAIGFPTVAVQAYFPSHVVGHEGSPAFWQWSKSNGNNDVLEMLGSAKPAYVLLGYGNEADRKLWTHLVTRSGYQQTKRFDGNLFWRDAAFQPEDFELYELHGQAENSVLASVIRSDDVKTADQMLWGLSDIVLNGSRSTGAGFSVALQRPLLKPGKGGVELEVALTIPERDFKRNGPVTLTAYVGGGTIAPMTLSAPGQYRYRRAVALDNLYWAIVPVAFHFDSTSLSLNSIPGEVALVSSVAFVAQ